VLRNKNNSITKDQHKEFFEFEENLKVYPLCACLNRQGGKKGGVLSAYSKYTEASLVVLLKQLMEIQKHIIRCSLFGKVCYDYTIYIIKRHLMSTEIEKLIEKKGLTAPRVTNQLIHDKIAHVEYLTHVCKSGKVLRWCCIEMHNGFVVTGEPSAAVSISNDDSEIGEKIAYKNAYNKIGALEGYLLAEKLNTKGVKND
jgi:hypothetical protein